MKIFLLLTLISTSLFAQRTSTIDADCLRIKDGTCIDKLELGYLDGLSGSIPTSLSGKVSTTGNESISGVKTFTDQLIASSTTKGFIPCPVMTETQRNAISSPVLGNCITNSTTASLNIYDGSNWKSAGGGLSSWVTARAYIVGDIVIESNRIYQCLIAHTSGTFATDLASVRWLRVSTDVSSATGVLPLVNGGTDKALTSVLGGVVYTDANSMEVLGAGTSGQELQSNGGAAPTWVNKSISGKAQNLTAVTMEELQVPNNLLTITAAGKFLSESGNKNILTDPSFEHSTRFGDGGSPWVVGAGSTSQETTIIIDGKKSARTSLTSETLSITQSSTLYASAFADGVQGLASCRIDSTVALKMCSIQAGTVSTTNCVNVNPDGKWGLYKIPFILGATSNGISIASSGSVTGTVYVDDCFVGAVDLKQDINNVGPWIAYTPTFTGFGTVTNNSFLWRQVGESVEVQGSFTTGTTAASLASITLPGSYTVNTSRLTRNNTTAAVGDAIGIFTSSQASAQSFVLTAPATSTSLVYVGSGFAGATNQVPANGSTAAGNTQSISLKFSVPISQLSGASSVYTAQNADTDWASCGHVAGDVINTGTGSAFETQCKRDGGDLLVRGKFTIGAGTNAAEARLGIKYQGISLTTKSSTYIASIQKAGSFVYNVASATSGAILIEPSVTYMTFGAQTGSAPGLTKQTGTQVAGATYSIDARIPINGWENSNVIIGTFNEVVTSPGISKPKTCHYDFGGASATATVPTECTSGTCVEVFDSCGTGTPPTWATAALYNNLTFASGTFAPSSRIKCECLAFDVTAANARSCDPYFDTSDQTWQTTASGGFVGNFAASATAFIQVTCEGQAP